MCVITWYGGNFSNRHQPPIAIPFLAPSVTFLQYPFSRMGNEAERKAVAVRRLPVVKSLDTDIVECFAFLWHFICSKCVSWCAHTCV